MPLLFRPSPQVLVTQSYHLVEATVAAAEQSAGIGSHRGRRLCDKVRDLEVLEVVGYGTDRIWNSPRTSVAGTDPSLSGGERRRANITPLIIVSVFSIPDNPHCFSPRAANRVSNSVPDQFPSTSGTLPIQTHPTGAPKADHRSLARHLAPPPPCIRRPAPISRSSRVPSRRLALTRRLPRAWVAQSTEASASTGLTAQPRRQQSLASAPSPLQSRTGTRCRPGSRRLHPAIAPVCQCLDLDRPRAVPAGSMSFPARLVLQSVMGADSPLALDLACKHPTAVVRGCVDRALPTQSGGAGGRPHLPGPQHLPPASFPH
ncbi:uncharacterized protein LOC123408124 [Hordeum vulgare subsp. vulgare]|uniref:uncharacterized protein LOC123408124 n=1 Tax=Hordeum vulgare subsp. vulgare TaxID=112509 RepID=UPI001D1A32F1|nr:uncharacterized protein LOC123408124 [Hordeum vulgare subsp. vulgare]